MSEGVSQMGFASRDRFERLVGVLVERTDADEIAWVRIGAEFVSDKVFGLMSASRGYACEHCWAVSTNSGKIYLGVDETTLAVGESGVIHKLWIAIVCSMERQSDVARVRLLDRLEAALGVDGCDGKGGDRP